MQSLVTILATPPSGEGRPARPPVAETRRRRGTPWAVSSCFKNGQSNQAILIEQTGPAGLALFSGFIQVASTHLTPLAVFLR